MQKLNKYIIIIVIILSALGKCILDYHNHNVLSVCGFNNKNADDFFHWKEFGHKKLYFSKSNDFLNIHIIDKYYFAFFEVITSCENKIIEKNDEEKVDFSMEIETDEGNAIYCLIYDTALLKENDYTRDEAIFFDKSDNSYTEWLIKNSKDLEEIELIRE